MDKHFFQVSSSLCRTKVSLFAKLEAHKKDRHDAKLTKRVQLQPDRERQESLSQISELPSDQPVKPHVKGLCNFETFR